MKITNTPTKVSIAYTGANGMRYFMDWYGRDITDAEMVTEALNQSADVAAHEGAWSRSA